ncbi:MAG: DUF2271 domain-containing protein [Lentisphaerae bacterium]|nr:DUF2271 domain-containing protein [Lentisphaerota bacterium]
MKRRNGISITLAILLALVLPAAPGRAQTTDGIATFRVGTVTANGRYAPRHVLAIWVTDSQTNFIKTLKRQAAARSQYLYQWRARTGGYAPVDGVSGATLSSHTTHTVTWDCRNTNGVVMPDGQYRFFVEFTELNGQGPWTATNSIAFTKSTASVTSNVPNLPNFTAMQIVFTPLGLPPPQHDLALSDLTAPPYVVPGNTAAVAVVVTNLGNLAETFTVSLSNVTQGVALAARAAGPVAAGGTTNVSLAWNTAGVAPATYQLRVTAGPVSGETNLTDNARTVRLTVTAGIATNALIGPGAIWRYQDEGLALHATPWRQEHYYDGAWPQGPAPLGFGNGGEATRLGRTDATTYYFRRPFALAVPPLSATARIVCDDGVVLYLNSAEIWRHNMPPSEPLSTTPAITMLSDTTETNAIEVALDPALLHAGINTLAAEVHQAAGGGAASPWINELHYDNSGTDTNEGIEIAGPSGYDLATLALVLYDGADGTPYMTVPLSGLIDREGRTSAGAVWFAINGIQDGAPDGVALVRDGTHVLQFLSCEGTFSATAGPAAGMTASDIGVVEPASPAGYSLQLVGSGSTGADFTWTGPVAQSRGALNADQILLPRETSDIAFDLRLSAVVPLFPVAPIPVIVGVETSGSALAGDVLPVSVTVSNSGTAGGGFRVILIDTNTQATIGTQEVNWLQPGALTTLTFDWATLGAAPGTYGLQAYVVREGVTNLPGGAALDAVIAGTGVRAATNEAIGGVGGFCRAVAVQDNLACLGEGAMLTLIDLAGVTRLGDVRLLGRIDGLAISGTLVAAACGERGVQFIDITDPAHPALLSIVDTAGHAGAVAFGDGLLAVANGRSGLRLLDVQDPAAPVVRGACQTAGPVRAVAWSAGRLFALDEHAGLLIYDVADPAAPALLGRAPTVAVGRGLAVDGPAVYVADELGFFTVLNVANPAAPVVQGRIPLVAAGGAVALRGSIAYVALGAAGIQIVDVTTPAAPLALGVVAAAGFVHDLARYDADTLLAAEGPAGLRWLDLAAPATPVPQAVHAAGLRAADVATQGPLALLACGEQGFRLYSLTNASAPELVAVSMVASNARAVAVAGAIAYVADGEYGLKAFAITNPAAPVWLGTYVPTGLVSLTRVAARGSDVAVTDGERVDLLDASNPAAMVLRARYAAGHRVCDLSWLGSDLVLAAGADGVRILDGQAQALATYPTAEAATAVEAADPYLYVANDRQGWFVLEATNHAAPQLLHRVTAPEAARDVAFDGARAVLAGDVALHILDVSVPLMPVQTSAIASRLSPRRVASTPATVLAAEDDAGLGVFAAAATDVDGDHLPDAWEQHIVDADPLDAIVTLADVLPGADFDGDGLSNADEIRAGSDPADGASCFALAVVQPDDGPVTLRWFSAPGRTYAVKHASALQDGFTPLATAIAATPPVNTFTVNPGTNAAAFFLVVTE